MITDLAGSSLDREGFHHISIGLVSSFTLHQLIGIMKYIKKHITAIFVFSR
ncbi:hypothetical protein ACFSCZ_05305 [Siminovitchia sediminis]|uniref:Uncharacterized protein n=1 Tax=Siminovitchia sediminis TaxID=1274353 RepID=A0ABW4KFC4_9BACI